MAEKPLVNPVAQDLLRRMGVTYEIQPDVDPSKITVNRTEGAQVRNILHVAPTKAVQKYAGEMGRGHKFPAVIVSQDGRLLDGNTRTEAAKIARVNLPVIRITVPLSHNQERLIQATMNTTHGVPLDSKEKRLVAETLLGTNPAPSVDDIAAAVGVSPTSVKRWDALLVFRSRAERHGVGIVDIKDGPRLLISGLKDDRFLDGVVTLTRDARLPDEEVKTLVSDVNAGLNKSAETAETVLDEWRARKNPTILEARTIGDVVPAKVVLAHLRPVLAVSPTVVSNVPMSELTALLPAIEDALKVLTEMRDIANARLAGAA